MTFRGEIEAAQARADALETRLREHPHDRANRLGLTADEPDAVSAVRAALNSWSDVVAGARRRAGDSIEIREVDPAGPVQVVLRTRYERRSVELRHTAAPRGEIRPPRPRPEVDPWAAAVDVPTDGSPWTHERLLEEQTVVTECPECTGWGKTHCPPCAGTGTVQQAGGSGSSNRCGRCRGSGEVECSLCGACGRTLATPRLRIEVGTAEHIRVVEDDELPLPVFFALQSRGAGGRRIFHEAGPLLEPRFGGGDGGPFRGGAARVSDRVNAAVNDLLAQEVVAGSYRRQWLELEILRVPAYRVDYGRGKRLWLYGENPPGVWPRGALRSPGWWALRAAPWSAVLAAAAGAAAWFWG